MAEISVTGRATRKVVADQATLSLSFDTHGDDRDAVIATASAHHRAVVARATELQKSGRIDRYVAKELRIWSNWAEVGETRLTEHFANVHVSLIVTNLDEIDEIVTEFTLSGNTVKVSWELSEALSLSVKRELRAEAVQDAKLAAEDYAEAIGVPTLTLLSLNDTRPSFGGEVMMARGGAPDALGITVEEIDVGVSISVTYAAA